MHHDPSGLPQVDYSPALGFVAAVAWVFHVVWEGLPPWSVVPALVFAVVTASKAWNDHLDRRQARRHAEQLHQARLRTPLPYVPDAVEPLR